IPKSSPKFPTIANLLAPAATTGEANSVASYTGLAHAHGLSIRIDEMNTVSCGGAPGVSDAFASALWATDALFEMARVGIDGVNIHTYPGATYALFDFKQVNGKWVGVVKPEYYGLMLFAQAAPPGSRLLATTVSHHGGVKAWATRAPDASTRVTLINHSTTAQTITLKTAPSAATATVQVLRAPGLAARAGISFAGQSFGSRTTTGTLRGHVQSATLTPVGSHYLVALPAASEALVTIPAG
ncbi:MAG: glycosyl hydrolase family 79 C-terminal domain-containing protein, partial [Actinomycetota bacterium]|nr:glycosyl hydrolase family 79 C-terminal domain-containing protein [Actinomycetota bacterium]